MIDGLISVLSGVIILVCSCILILGIWDDQWFRFGPNEDLEFLKIPINTSAKYYSLLSLLCIVYAAKAVGDFYIDPWIQARYLGLISQRFDNTWLSLHVSLWRVYSWVMTLLMVQIVLSQFDLWLFGVIVTIIVDLWITYTERNNEGFTTAEIRTLKKMAQNATQ